MTDVLLLFLLLFFAELLRFKNRQKELSNTNVCIKLGNNNLEKDLAQFDQNLLKELQDIKLKSSSSDLIQSLLNKKSRDELAALRQANDRGASVAVDVVGGCFGEQKS